MKFTNLTIKDLITPTTKLTFLIGAGCSVDPPSCLPVGRAMMDAIIDYTCAESEIDKIKELKDLRFEQLIEIIRDQSDPDLRIIDLYELSDKPNIQHFFLANMIKKGSFIITTNFDFLIEYALQQSGVSLNDILPVITKQDFIEFQDPYKQLSKGKYTLYKIHGSTKNIIQDKSTRDSLIATLQAFGANKKGESIFQLESFKQPAFTNLTENRSLVVMGYSGSDDFDIVPTLKVLRNLENIIWINYVTDDGGKENIYELTADIIGKPEGIVDKVNQILVDILRFNDKVRIYRVDTNTSRLIEDLLDTKPALSSDKFSINIGDWLKESIKLDLVKFREREIPVPIQILKYYTSYRIYQDLNVYDHAERCLESIIEIAKEKGEDYWRATAIYELGQISHYKGHYSRALNFYEESLNWLGDFGDFEKLVHCYIDMGTIFNIRGNYSQALEKLEEALKLSKLLDVGIKAKCLNSIGLFYANQHKYPEALKNFEEALKITKELGNLGAISSCLANIGGIYRDQGNYAEALKRYEESYKIAEELGDLPTIVHNLNDIGLIYQKQKLFSKALINHEKALKIIEQLGDLAGKSVCLNNIGGIYNKQGNYSETLKMYEKAYQIAEQLEDMRYKAICTNNIAQVYEKQNNLSEAINCYEKALKLAENYGDKSESAYFLSKVGAIYERQNNYIKALEKYKETLQLVDQLGDQLKIVICLNSIGIIYLYQRKYDEALKSYEEAFRIAAQLGDLKLKSETLKNIGVIYMIQGDVQKAMKHFKQALEILNELGLTKSSDAKEIIELIKTIQNKL